MTLTEEMIEEGRSEAGGWTKRQLALLGVAWPPQSGWKQALIGSDIDQTVYAEFVSLKCTRQPIRRDRT